MHTPLPEKDAAFSIKKDVIKTALEAKVNQTRLSMNQTSPTNVVINLTGVKKPPAPKPQTEKPEKMEK